MLYLPSLSAAIARRPLIKDVHFWTGISWAGAILIISLLGNRPSLAQTAREIDLFDRDDGRFLAGDTRSPQGRFNAGQKVNAILTAAFATLFFVSGLLLWYGERDTRFRLGGTVYLHDTLMYLSVVIVVGHLYLSLLHPTTRHALRGMTLGTVREAVPSMSGSGCRLREAGQEAESSATRTGWPLLADDKEVATGASSLAVNVGVGTTDGGWQHQRLRGWELPRACSALCATLRVWARQRPHRSRFVSAQTDCAHSTTSPVAGT